MIPDPDDPRIDERLELEPDPVDLELENLRELGRQRAERDERVIAVGFRCGLALLSGVVLGSAPFDVRSATLVAFLGLWGGCALLNRRP